VEQVTRQPHILVAEQLAGVRLPSVLFTIKTDPAAKQKDGASQIGVSPKNQVM
jgi:hypothetical protein